MNLLLYYLYCIGYWGPLILFILTTVLLLIYKSSFLKYYIFFNLIGFVLNCLVKTLIQEPRPKSQRHLYEFEKNEKIKHIVGAGSYGMPSGHSQISFYSLVTILFVIKNYLFRLVAIFITAITCWQRYKFRNHTIPQILTGSVFGILYFLMAKSVYLVNE